MDVRCYYAVDEFGYRVQLYHNDRLIEDYSAGNNPHESAVSVTLYDLDEALPVSKLHAYARQTARELLEENFFPLLDVSTIELTQIDMDDM